ncbi:MAG: hypothetical protein U0793_11120 [Gemmataceae bacterium]
MPTTNLLSYLATLRAAPVIPRPPKEEWAAMIARTARPGVICEIDEETYDYFLDVLPPRYLGRGFAFAEGAESFRYFWHVKPAQYFCRQLTWDETVEFCRLADISLPW